MITINGTALADMGVILLRGAYAELMAPVETKNYVENDDPTKHGVEIDTLISPKLKKREVTLSFFVKGTSEADFISKYNAFLEVLYSGYIELVVPDLSACFRLIYRANTKYANYRLNACEVAVKFTEPDPTNRAL